MKYLILLALAFVGLVSQSYATIIEGVEPLLDFSHSHEVNEFKVHNQYLKVIPESYRFPEGKQKEKFEKALSILEQVLNSTEFRTKVLTYKRGDGKRLYQKNYLWNDKDNLLSNEDVYNILMAADEKMRPNTFGEMNINALIRKCSWFKQKVSVWCRRVIGSTNPHVSEIMTLNWKFYSRYEVPNMVANIVHEWIHLLGFLHGSKNMDQEVPYVVGSIAGEVARGILNKE